MKDLLSRSNVLATLVCVIVIALGYGLLSADESDRAERMNGPVSLETQKVSVDGGVNLESEAVEISAEKAPEPEAAEESVETPVDVPEAMEEPVEDALPAEDYETLPEIPVDEEIPAEGTEGTEEPEIPAEEFEQGEEDLCPAVLEFARGQLGDAYVMGGEGPDAWSSDGLVQAAFAQAGIDVPRTVTGQAEAGESGTGAACDIAVANGKTGIVTETGTIISAVNPQRGVSEGDWDWAGEVTYVDVLP